MTSTLRRLFVSAFTLAMVALCASGASAQGGATTSLAGTVTDPSGAVIPGASVVVKNMATAAVSEAVTNTEGQFTVPALNAGTYSVTVSLAGFKTVTVNDVILNAGVPAGVKVTMQVGGIEEQVVVTGGSEVVATQSSTVSTTMSSKQIAALPLTSRNAMDFVVNLPGVNTPGTARNSTVNGLPQGAINITLDGISIQDNYLKTSDGFFARVQPRLDAIEEVTVTSASNGADSGGQGAVNVRFVTKSGTNAFKGSTFFTLRHDALNANSFFNNRNLPPDPATGKAPKAALRQYQPGFNAGGPIVIPGIWDGHDKAFFFFNYEDSRSPSNARRDRVILTAAAAGGAYTYGSTTVNLLQLAAANGQTATLDPIIAKLFADMRAASAQGSITNLADPILQQASFQVPTKNFTPYPLGRIDYNISKNHRLSGSVNYNHVNSTPDTTNNREPFFPGFPNTGSQQSTRYTTSNSLRSTFGANVVNELRVGASGGATFFSPELSPGLFGGNSVGDQGGYYLNMGNGCCSTALANAGNNANFSAREAATRVVEDTFNWVNGNHNLSFGASWTRGQVWLQNQQMVPELRFGIATGDPAAAMFTTANFPGASNTQLNNARALYGLLTGRVTSVRGTVRLNENTNKYEYLGNGFQRGHMNSLGFFAQDNWRLRNNLTINAGLRYELQTPFVAHNNSYSTATLADLCGVSGVAADGGCNLFKAGTLTGRQPQLVNYAKGTKAFNTDLNNLAPSLGITWRPARESGFLRTLFGAEGDTVFFGSYAMSYERLDLSSYTGPLGTNPGVSLNPIRDTTQSGQNALNNDGLGLPVLLRQTNRLGPGGFPSEQSYPLTPQRTDNVDIFNPDIQTPYAQTWAGGIRRKVTRDLGVEVRYVGSRHLQGWGTINLNELDIVNNGFVNEFRQAQRNLQANIAGGQASRGFAYTGLPGTGPLPIYLAYFTGTPTSQAGDPARYTGNLWNDTNFTNPLAAFNPQPFTPAGTNANTGLSGDPARRTNALAAGLPANLFQLNPDINNANFETNVGRTKYDSLQIDVTKRLSHGFLLQGGYVFGNSYESVRYSLKTPYKQVVQTGDPGSITHALKFNWIYELPFGNGRRFLGNASGLLDRLVGGWEIDGIARIQSGRMVDVGNVRLVGMSKKDLQNAYKRYEYAPTGVNSSAPVNIYMLPQDILENTVRAFSTSATSATGYGTLGPPSGRYLAPANGPDCLETTNNTATSTVSGNNIGSIGGSGDCGIRSLALTGPLYHRVDISAVKRTRIVGRTMFEFRADLINAFNHPNFTPVGFPTSFANATNADNYRVTGVQENSSRIIQLVTRFSW
ncbi:MAG TPA: carboxypeptidase-like regulatory domain-containing protein [Vicinamibacterales bacterium]|nr:carboxypeptidase-like regulatory domain-containing protein [Vicinamibacterales bacterium]